MYDVYVNVSSICGEGVDGIYQVEPSDNTEHGGV